MTVRKARKRRRRDLVRRACTLFPTLALRKRWVRAKERLGAASPSVDIGIERADTTRAARSLREAGITSIQQEFEVPEFLKKLLRLR